MALGVIALVAKQNNSSGQFIGNGIEQGALGPEIALEILKEAPVIVVAT